MNTFKTNKGITLVALIITKIVLLILTVVAISSITDQGLFKKSLEAVNKYEESREEEQGKLTGYATEINKYLQKDRVYRHAIVDLYLKITKDNKIEMGDSNTVYETAEFEYVSVTPDIITIVNGYGDPIPDSVKDSSRALKVKIGENEWIYLLLSKDEKILLLQGEELILDGNQLQIREWTTYGTDTQYYLVGTNVAYFIYEGDIFMTFTVETGTLEDSDEYGSYTIPSYLQKASKVLKSSEGRIAAVIMSDKSFYSIGLGMDRIQATRLNLNNGINYSEILNKIENPT